EVVLKVGGRGGVGVGWLAGGRNGRVKAAPQVMRAGIYGEVVCELDAPGLEQTRSRGVTTQCAEISNRTLGSVSVGVFKTIVSGNLATRFINHVRIDDGNQRALKAIA